MINKYYYGFKRHTIVDKDKFANSMKDCNFPSVGKCIVGRDFILILSCGADSYRHFQGAAELSRNVCKSKSLYHEAKIIAEKDASNLYTTKSKEECLFDLGLSEAGGRADKLARYFI